MRPAYWTAPAKSTMVSAMASNEEEVVVSAWVGSGAASHAIGCLIALAVIPLVAVAVNLFSGDQLPRGLEGSTPHFAVAAGVFAVAALWFYRRSRKRAEVVRVGDGLAIRVDGQEIVRSPFELAYGYQKQKIAPRAPRTTVLILGVVVNGACAVSFIEEWGAAYGAPDWPEGWPQLSGTPRSFRILGGRKFSTELVRLATARPAPDRSPR
jgi:hypothetical protein